MLLLLNGLGRILTCQKSLTLRPRQIAKLPIQFYREKIMTNEKKAAPAAKPVAAAKPPKKLIPRTAPKIESALDPILAEAAPVTVPEVATQPVAAPAAPRPSGFSHGCGDGEGAPGSQADQGRRNRCPASKSAG
jgi:hypothetical protein